MSAHSPYRRIGHFGAAALCLCAALSLVTAPADLQAQTNFGTSTAVAGGEVLIGQPANFYGPGSVYVYQVGANDEWTETGRLFAPDSVLADMFGRSLAVAGDRLLVGSPASDGAGKVYLFSRGEGGWSSVASLEAPGSEGGFGITVAVAGDVGFVGAPSGDGGAVYVVDLSDPGMPVTATLRSADGDRFGSVVSLDDEYVVVGDPGTGDGTATVFRRGDGGWTEDGVLTPDPEGNNTNGGFGSAVHISGSRAFVGAPRAGRGIGVVTVFDRGADGWTRAGEIAPDDVPRGARFGTSLASAGGQVWVGAPGAGGGDGLVYRLEEDAGDWVSASEIAADSSNTAAWPFGFGNSIATDGEVAVIGMSRRDFGEGRAGVFQEAGGAWDEVATLSGEIAKAAIAIEEGADCEEGAVQWFECNNMEVVSFTPTSNLGGPRGVWVNDVWGWTDPVTGRDYALVARRDGAAFMDLTDPASPRLVGSLLRTEGSRPSVWRDIKVVNDHAFIVSDGAGAHGMQIFDLTRLRDVGDEPVEFEMDAHYDRVFSAHNVVADTESGFVYIVGANGGGDTCGGGLHMVDVRDPKNPVFAGCYSDATGAQATGYTHDAQCLVYGGPDERYGGRQICVGSNGTELNIADVTDKDNPVPVGRSSYPNVAYAHQGWFDESQRYFYMGDEVDEVSGTVEGTRTLVWDLTELDDPILVNEYVAPFMATDHNMFIRGDRIYQSNYGSGLRVLDISDPENPYEVAFFDSAPRGNNEAGMSSAQSGAWSNYPFFESGLVVFTSVREGLFVVRVKPRELIP